MEQKKTTIPLTAAVLKSFSELASEPWERATKRESVHLLQN